MLRKILEIGLINSKNNALISYIKFVIVLFGLIIGSQIRIYVPFTPVPITAQTLVVMLGSAWIGNVLAPLAIITYIVLGLIGLPVFAGGGGFYKLIGPTGGYLLGFVIVSWLISKVINKNSTLSLILGIFSLGSVLILCLGTAFLSYYLGISFCNSLNVGFLPFLPGELLKVAVAAGVYRMVIAKY